MNNSGITPNPVNAFLLNLGVGTNTPITSSDTILTGMQNLQAQITAGVPDANKADKSTLIAAGTSLNGGGSLAADRTINHNNFGTPGTYGTASSVPVFTTEVTGHVTAVVATPIQITQSQVTGLTTNLSGKANLAGGNALTGNQSVTSGSVAIGTVTQQASSILTLDSTTQGFLMPRVTTTQMEAIATPAIGLQVFNTTLNTVCVFNGITWIFEYAQFTTATQTSSSVTYANITELVSPVLPAGRYQVAFTGTFQSTSTVTGIGLRLSNGTATVAAVVIDWSITQAGNGTAKNFFYTQIAAAADFTSASATVANGDLPTSCRGILQISAAGTMAVQIRSETAASAVSIRANSVICYRRVS